MEIDLRFDPNRFAQVISSHRVYVLIGDSNPRRDLARLAAPIVRACVLTRRCAVTEASGVDDLL